MAETLESVLLEPSVLKAMSGKTKLKVLYEMIGELNELPTKLQKLIKLSEKKTINKKLLQVNIALNYGSKIKINNYF